MAVRILLVEDDGVLAGLIRKGLEGAGYSVDVAGDGIAGLEAALAGPFDLILLDVMLPGRDGFALCQALRRRRNTTPVLMLTARDAVDDRVRGLELGADDYLPKPFEFAELLARARALLRRDKLHRTRVVRIADLEIDTASRRVRRAGRDVQLAPREYALLEMLALNEGRVISRDIIEDRVWTEDEHSSNTVNVHVARLRRKIDGAHAAKLIHTVHGFGYVLRRPETVDGGDPAPCTAPSASG